MASGAGLGPRSAFAGEGFGIVWSVYSPALPCCVTMAADGGVVWVAWFERAGTAFDMENALGRVTPPVRGAWFDLVFDATIAEIRGTPPPRRLSDAETASTLAGPSGRARAEGVAASRLDSDE